MRVLAIMYRPIQLWAFGGSERRFAAMARELAHHYSVEFETVEPSPPLSRKLAVEFRSFPVVLPSAINIAGFVCWLALGALRVWILARNRTYDVVYSTNNNLYNLVLAHIAKALTRAPLAVVVHHFRWIDYRVDSSSASHKYNISAAFRLMRSQGLDLTDSVSRALASAVENRLVARADACIVPTEAVAEQVKSVRFTGQLNCVGNGVDRIPPNSDATDANPRPDAFYLGRVDEGKGILELLDVWRIVCHSKPNATLVIAGTGKLLAKAIQRSAHLAIKRNVIFTGHCSDDEVRRLSQSARVFVSLSTVEGWGIAAGEALAHGIPAVVAEIPPLREVYGGCPSVLFVEPKQPIAAADAIVRLLNLSDEERRKLSGAAREHVRQLSWQHAAELEYKALQEVSERRSG